MSEAKFGTMAPGIMRRLMADLSISKDDAAAILGNLGHETGGFSLMYEAGKPIARQGFGWAQWTGERRDQFEAWAAERGLDPHSDEANYGFLVHELTNTWEKRALVGLENAETLADKTLAFMRLYERPGVPHGDRRVRWAELALDTFNQVAAITKGKPMIVPPEWMPPADMDRIIVHWTAGSHKANSVDQKHYHLMIEGDGTVVRGDKSIQDNESARDGVYAAHTLNCNTGSIGVSMCAMADAKEHPFNPGRYPLTREQWDAMVGVVADLAGRYGIPVTPKTVLTHAEVQPNLGIAQRGKWDIAILPFDPAYDTAAKVGDRLRQEVAKRLAGQEAAEPRPEPKPDPAPTSGKAGGIFAGILAAVAAVIGAAWQFASEHLIGISIGLAVLIAAGLIAYRIWRKRWPWTSIGNQLPAPSPRSPQSSVQSLEQASAALSAVLSAESPAAPSRAPSASKPRRKRSVKPSRKTKTRSKSSGSSKRRVASKSSKRRKSKSSG